MLTSRHCERRERWTKRKVRKRSLLWLLCCGCNSIDVDDERRRSRQSIVCISIYIQHDGGGSSSSICILYVQVHAESRVCVSAVAFSSILNEQEQITPQMKIYQKGTENKQSCSHADFLCHDAGDGSAPRVKITIFLAKKSNRMQFQFENEFSDSISGKRIDIPNPGAFSSTK